MFSRANYVVAVDGQFELVFGTSASSPALASILYAINDARLAIGKKPIGFINPTVCESRFPTLVMLILSLTAHRSTRTTSGVRSMTSQMVRTLDAERKVSVLSQDGIRSLDWVHLTSPNYLRSGYYCRKREHTWLFCSISVSNECIVLTSGS